MDYNPLPRELESILNQTTIVELCDDNYPIPRETFKFFLASEVKSLDRDTIVYLIGTVTEKRWFYFYMSNETSPVDKHFLPKYYINFVGKFV